METCRITDTYPLIHKSGFLKIWTVNKRKEIMYVLVTFHFPQKINFSIWEWKNMFTDKKFEGYEYQLLCFIEETSHNICKFEIRLYVLIVNLNYLWNKSGYRYTHAYMYVIYIILICPCLEEKKYVDCFCFKVVGRDHTLLAK